MTEELKKRIIDSITTLMDYVDHDMPPPGHPGSCTPETQCDEICVDISYRSSALAEASRVVSKVALLPVVR